MDYRTTHDFAQQMQAAEWRAHDLRVQAMASFWQGVAMALRRAITSRWQAHQERRADAQLWKIAQSDPRVMADLRHAMKD